MLQNRNRLTTNIFFRSLGFSVSTIFSTYSRWKILRFSCLACCGSISVFSKNKKEKVLRFTLPFFNIAASLSYSIFPHIYFHNIFPSNEEKNHKYLDTHSGNFGAEGEEGRRRSSCVPKAEENFFARSISHSKDGRENMPCLAGGIARADRRREKPSCEI